jgi:hypothetical protein
MSHHDLDWLVDERPASPPPDADATARARAALVAHADAPSVTSAPTRAIDRTRPATPRRRIRTWRVAAAAGVTVVVVAALAVGGGWFATSTPEAGATPLLALAAQVKRSTPPTGDATLVERHQAYPDGRATDGFDLYLDDGSYYYSDTRAGLPGVIAAPPDPLNDRGWITRDKAAALAALQLPIDEARHGMSIANLDPSAPPVATPAAIAEAKKIIAEKRLAAGTTGTTLPPSTPEQLENGSIWSNSMDALTAGAGQPKVRAGVLRLLATIPTVSVDSTVTQGQPTLQLRQTFPDGYVEQLVVDADTGLPVQLTGGYPGKTPGVIVTYGVTRLDAASLTQG